MEQINKKELVNFLASCFTDMMKSDLSWADEYKKKTGKDPFANTHNTQKESNTSR